MARSRLKESGRGRRWADERPAVRHPLRPLPAGGRGGAPRLARRYRAAAAGRRAGEPRRLAGLRERRLFTARAVSRRASPPPQTRSRRSWRTSSPSRPPCTRSTAPSCRRDIISQRIITFGGRKNPLCNEHTSEGGRDDRGVPYHAESTLSSAQVLSSVHPCLSTTFVSESANMYTIVNK